MIDLLQAPIGTRLALVVILTSTGPCLIDCKQGCAMIEFRWVAFLTLWSVLVGPVLDLAHTRNTHATHPKAPATAKVRTTR